MRNAIEDLDKVIDETLQNMSVVTNNPNVHFTRNRKLNAKTTIKTILNMQGNTIDKELRDLFPDMKERMTESAFVQARGKISEELFEHIFRKYGEEIPNMKTYKGYQLLAIDGSDFNTPYSSKSEYVVDLGTDRKPTSRVHGNLLMDIRNRIFTDCIL